MGYLFTRGRWPGPGGANVRHSTTRTAVRVLAGVSLAGRDVTCRQGVPPPPQCQRTCLHAPIPLPPFPSAHFPPATMQEQVERFGGRCVDSRRIRLRRIRIRRENSWYGNQSKSVKWRRSLPFLLQKSALTPRISSAAYPFFLLFSFFLFSTF